MALTWTDLTSKTQDYIVPRLADTVYKASPGFTRLRTKRAERFEGGLKIVSPIMYAELNGGVFGKGDTFDTSYVPTDTALQFDMKHYYVGITLYGTDDVLNRGPESAMAIVESKMVNAAGKMAKLVATDMYLDGQGTNSSSQAIDGFQAAFDNGGTFGSYGALDRSDLVADSTNNQGINGYAATMATLSLKTINTAFGSCWFGSEHVDLIVSTQTVWDLFWNKMLPLQRVLNNDTDVAKIGFSAFNFNGAQVVVDQYCPSGYMFGINTNSIQFYMSAVKKFQWGFTGFKEAPNTIDVTGQYLYSGNIVCSNPRFNFILSGITA